jgi:hypothetical protein
MRRYAAGCFAPGEPITLQGLPVGEYQLLAGVLAAESLLANASAPFFAVAEPLAREPSAAPGSASVFEPTYEWRELRREQSVPAGLEIQLPLDGAPRRARIPSEWRLQLYLGKGYSFFRADVSRGTPLRALEEQAAAYVAARRRASAIARLAPAWAGGCVALWHGAERLAPSMTAEEAQLFARRGKLVARPCDGAAPHAGAVEAEAKANSHPRAVHSGGAEPEMAAPADGTADSSAGASYAWGGTHALMVYEPPPDSE